MHDSVDLGSLPRAEFAFPGPLRDKLVSAILDGSKTTTSSLVEEYQRTDESLPIVGNLSVLIDSHGQEIAVLEVVGVDIVPLAEVTLQHALGEGEGFTTMDQWREEHLKFWTSKEFLEANGEPPIRVDGKTPIVCESFRLKQLLP